MLQNDNNRTPDIYTIIYLIVWMVWTIWTIVRSRT